VSNNHAGANYFVSAFTTVPSHGSSLVLHIPTVLTSITSIATSTRCSRYGGLSCRWATMPKAEASATTSEETSNSSTSLPSSSPPVKRTNSSKLRQLKDRMWVRETLEDITAAEFASSLSVEVEDDDNHDTTSTSSSNGSRSKRNDESSSMTNTNGVNKLSSQIQPPRRKRAVDFDNILKKLDARIDAMCIITTPETAQRMNQTCHIIDRRVFGGGEEDEEDDDGGGGNKIYIENACYSLDENVGMGSVVYSFQQREALLSRLISTRMRLVNFIEGRSSGDGSGGNGISGNEEDSIDDIRSQLLPTEDSATISSGLVDKSTTAESSKPTTSAAASFDPSLYVREDGTVDWDGALQDREALKKFGSAVWSRINGQDPEEGSEDANTGEGNEAAAVVVSPKSVGGEAGNGSVHHSPTKAVTAKIEETEAIREKREQLNVLMSELQQMEVEHIKLLNSGELAFVTCFLN
jgi:hypothetical protein